MASSGSYNNPKPGVLFHQPTKESPIEHGNRRTKSFKTQLSKGESKKTLVRNTELTVYPTIYKTDEPVVEDKRDKKKEAAPQSVSTGLYKTNLSAPCLNSALRIVKEMKQASKARPSNSQCAKLMDEGKVLQQVNFLYEEHLYHDLVALNVSDTDVVESSSSRNSSRFRPREKDKEPQLSQFFTPTFSEEYQIPRNPPRRVKTYPSSSGNFTIYQRMRSWNVE